MCRAAVFDDHKLKTLNKIMKNTLDMAIIKSINAGFDISFEIVSFIFSALHFKNRPNIASIIPDIVNKADENISPSNSGSALNIGA